MSVDDKAKVPVGEPGGAVSTGVRGMLSIVPTDTTLVALDQGMVKTSLTPSVVLNCKIPEKIDKYFVNGTVTNCVNDSVFQSASPFRHAVMLAKVCSSMTRERYVFQHTPFKEFDLDMLMPERVMSILNLGLQNVSLQREKGP